MLFIHPALLPLNLYELLGVRAYPFGGTPEARRSLTCVSVCLSVSPSLPPSVHVSVLRVSLFLCRLIPNLVLFMSERQIIPANCYKFTCVCPVPVPEYKYYVKLVV